MSSKPEYDYDLLYWPEIPGRGEPIRLLLEEAGVPYRDVAKEDGAVEEVLKVISPDFVAPAGYPPPFAPPVLRVASSGRVLSQSASIMLYLADNLPGLLPADEPDARYTAHQLVLTALDLQDEAHDTHHPIASSLYYEDQKAEAKRRAADFRDVRVPKFFSYFDRVITQSGPTPTLLRAFSYADLVLWHVVDGVRFAFPKAAARALAAAPRVQALYEAVRERERVKAYLGSARRVGYGDGVYRYYEELDE